MPVSHSGIESNQLMVAIWYWITTKIVVVIAVAAEWIKTKTVAEWNKQVPVMGKTPAVFLMLG